MGEKLENMGLVDIFKCCSNEEQLNLLTSLLKVSAPEVKFHFQTRVEEITKHDIISEVPSEIIEGIFVWLEFSSLLQCRLVCRAWCLRVSQCIQVWLPFLEQYGIDYRSFTYHKVESDKPVNAVDTLIDKENLNIIGARMFTLPPVIRTHYSYIVDTLAYNDSYFRRFYMGRKALSNFKSLACFQNIIDHDCCGSNVVMAMNDEIIAYAREDRHIVIRYVNFPYKKIRVFETHQCADLKILNDLIITGGYDRTICIWYWVSGVRYCCLEGSLKPILSLDVIGDLLVSSDGKSVITWDIGQKEMLVKSPIFNDDGIVEELKLINPSSNNQLEKVYRDALLVTRSYHAVKVWLLHLNGTLTFLSILDFDKKLYHLEPYIKVWNNMIACSSEFGILVWNLLDFSLISHEVRKPYTCICRFMLSAPCRHTRVILLYYSPTYVMQYFVTDNYFQLLSLKSNGEVAVKWNFPSDEKWPWAHRKPGITYLVSDFENGFTEATKIIMFVATQNKKIYGMNFDASDVEELNEFQSLIESRTWNALMGDNES